jgi:hypothetical protein
MVHVHIIIPIHSRLDNSFLPVSTIVLIDRTGMYIRFSQNPLNLLDKKALNPNSASALVCIYISLCEEETDLSLKIQRLNRSMAWLVFFAPQV